MSPSPFLFATAIDSSTARWEEDFSLVRQGGLNALRYGPAYHRTHAAPDRYDWELADLQMARLAELGITVIADLCHFEAPSWLDGVDDPAFPVLFAEYARAFARRYPWVRHYTPIHEIFASASRPAPRGSGNECAAGDTAFVRAIRNLCMAHELAVEAILSERRDGIIVQCESIEHFHAAGQGARAEADRWNALRQLPIDLTVGHELAPGMARFLHEHGVPSHELSFFREKRAVGQRWLGVDYFTAREHRITSTGRQSACRTPIGFKRLATQYYQRYRLPVFHGGTNRAGSQAVAWLDGQWSDIVAMRASGIPVMGFTWHSLTDQVEGGGAPRAVGMYDLDRRIRPVGARYAKIVRQWRGVLAGDARTSAAELMATGTSA